MEFVGTVGLALVELRTWRNTIALPLTVLGVLILIDICWSLDIVGLALAFIYGALFVLYIMLGYRAGAGQGIGCLGVAMAIAFVIVLPIGFAQAFAASAVPALLLAGIGVGICSSVIPYICDQLAMARLPLASFAMMLALLPATATVIGAVVLDQIPSASDLVGIALVMGGVALHRTAARG